MVLKVADRVLEATTTTGTSNFSLAGAVTGYVTFAGGIGNGNRCYYAAVHSDLANYDEWEVGIGTVSGGALSRQPISSSNGGAKVNFSVGTKHVFATMPAVRTIFYDDDGKIFVGPSGDSATFNNDEIFHVKGDIFASGVNVGSGLSLAASSAPADTTGRLYNVGGSLFWDGTNISTSDGQQLFSIIAGPSGSTETEYSNFPVMMGSGIIFKAGEGMSITIDHPDHAPGQGSGILTFNALQSGTLIRITAPSGEVGAQGQEYELGYGSGIVFEGERNIDIQLNNNGAGSGILTFRGPDLSSYINAVASGIELQNNTAVATTGNTLQRGIVQLTNEITDSSGLALTPRAVYDAGYLTGADPILNIGATTQAGTGLAMTRAPSGLFFEAGSNMSVTLTEPGNGSGILTFAASNTDTTYGAASGLVMDGDNIIRHEASAASSVNNTNPFFIQDITIDNFGHITAINSASVTTPEVSTSLFLASSGSQPDVNLGDGSGILLIGDDGITVTVEDGQATQNNGSGIVTIRHNDTSTQSSVNNSGNTFIQDITLDNFGHVTAIASASVSAASTNINTDGTPTPVASGGIPIFQDSDSIHFDPNLTWDSGNLNGTLTIAGYVKIDQLAAPSVTTDKLYNVGGNLIWNGTNLSAGLGAGAITSDGPNSPEASGIPFFSSSDEVGYDNRLVFASGSATSAKLGITTGSEKENNFPHSTLHADGSFATRFTSVTGINDEATDTDSVIMLDNRHIDDNMTFYLPKASTCQGRTYTLIRNSNHASGITISGSGDDRIDGQSTETLWVDGDTITLLSSSGNFGFDYGWKAISREYTPHTVRFSLLPTGVAARTNPGSIVEYASDGNKYVNYQWNVGAFMTFEGTQWSIPFLASDGNMVGTNTGFVAQSGLVQNYKALRDGYYKVDFHLESKRAYAPDYHHVRFGIIRYPFRGTEAEANPSNLTTALARLELITIANRTNTTNNGSISYHNIKESQGGDGPGINFFGNASDTIYLEKNDRLVFLLASRNRSGSLHLNDDGSNFPDTTFFKAQAEYTNVTVTEIR
tara:strand:+ start:1064 stop:4210 length:3147 start_codon:yes stop_codon:yes gene_type:complete